MAQPAPAKPWERARGVVSTAAPLLPVASTPTTATTTATALPAATTAPSLPPRHAAAVAPTSFLGGYGTGMGGMYGGGYSRYHSPYGGGMYGGYSSGVYGGGGGMLLPQPLGGGVLEKSFGMVHGVMEQFSRLSYLLGANFEALRNSFVSFLGLYEGLAPLLTVVQSLSIYRIVRAIFRKLYALAMWLLGVDVASTAPAAASTTVATPLQSSVWGDEYSASAQSSGKAAEDTHGHPRPAPLLVRAIVGAALAIGIPLLVSRFAAFFRRSAATAAADRPPSAPGVAAVFEAAHDFGTSNPGELSLRRGDRVRVLDPRATPGQQSWAQAEVAGRRGLVPLNYLAPLTH